MQQDQLKHRSGPRPVEERLRRRDRVVGWTLFGLLLLALAMAAGVVLVALPMIVIAFPLTLSAIAIVVIIGWWRGRRAG